MKYYYFTILFAFLIFNKFAISQWYDMIPYKIMEYENFIIKGDSLDNNRHGKWIKVSDSGIVYSESFYNKGIPVDTWKVNFPDGILRKQTSFNDSGDVIKLSRFSINEKLLFEIKPDIIISYPCLKVINELEQKIFDKESVVYVHEDALSSGRNFKIPISTMYFSYVELLEEINDLLCDYGFNGVYLNYYESGNLALKNIIEDDKKIAQWRYYYNNKGILTRNDVFIGKELSKIIKYDKDGNIRKTKNIAEKNE